MRTFEWAIEGIFEAHPSLYLEHCAAMAVLLMKPIAQPCEFLVQVQGFDVPSLSGDDASRVRILWSAETESDSLRIEQTEQRKPIVERAAIALAALLLSHFHPDSELEIAKHGDGADYWLPKLSRAVEVSGTEAKREIDRRCRQKRDQMLMNRQGWNGFVVVCCFAPDQLLIRWNYHSQKEHTTDGSREKRD